MLKKLFENLEEAAGVALLAFMSILAFLNVLTRYFIHYSFASTEEIEVACLVWLTMLGASAGFRRGIHLGFDLLALRLPRFGRRVLFPFASLLTVVTVIVLIRFSLIQIRDEVALNIASEALSIPQWFYTLALPVGGVLIIVRVVEATWRKLRGGR